MVYELRIYTAAPGRMGDVLERFEAHTLGIWERLGIRTAGFWTAHDATSTNDLTYMLVWDSLGERDVKWPAFVTDPEWIAAKEASEAQGPIVVNMANSFLTPASFSSGVCHMAPGHPAKFEERGAPVYESASARPGDFAKGPSDFLILLTLAIGFVMAMIDTTAVNVALPDISASLSVPLSGLVWVVDGYTLTFAAFLLAGGALADRWGPKFIYQSGLALFVFASLLCGMAPGGQWLVAARLLQGVGAALFMPSSLSLLAHTYTDDRKRAKMLGIWSAMVGAAATIGPLVGGALIHALGWRSVFWVNVPLGLLGIALAYLLIPPAPKQPHPLSWLSHAVGALVLAALSVFLIEGPNLGWRSAPVLLAAGVTLAATAILIGRERTSSSALLPLALRQAPGFAAVNLTGFLNNLGMFGQLFLLSLYLQGLGSSDPLTTGLQLMPMMATITTGNFLSSRVSARFGTRNTMWVSFSVASILAVAILVVGLGTPLRLLVGVCIMNFFVGIAVPAMTTTAMQIADRSYANGAAAALNANRQIGALVGVALMGVIIHSASTWDTRLLLGLGVVAVAFGLAAALVYRFIRRP